MAQEEMKVLFVGKTVNHTLKKMNDFAQNVQSMLMKDATFEMCYEMDCKWSVTGSQWKELSVFIFGEQKPVPGEPIEMNQTEDFATRLESLENKSDTLRKFETYIKQVPSFKIQSTE